MNYRKLLVKINFWRTWPIVLYLTVNRKRAEDLFTEAEAWAAPHEIRKIRRILYLLVNERVYRNLFYVRMWNPIMKIYSRMAFPGEATCEIDTKKIGIGLVIYHGYSTVIAAHSIGKNCCIWQNVTLGRRPKSDGGIDTPIIGDNVRIYTGAIVIGGISIGDNAKIAAGSVVLKDVPANCLVAGVPAVVVKKYEE